MSTKTDSLHFRIRTGISPTAIEKMKKIRKAFIAVSEVVETLGTSRESSLACTHIQSAFSALIKHICLTDPEAVKEELN